MNYKLLFEKPENISKDCPFLPADADHEMYLSAIIEDINSIDGILNVKRLTDGRVVVATDGMNKDVFLEKLKPLLSNHFCYLRLPLKNIEVLQKS